MAADWEVKVFAAQDYSNDREVSAFNAESPVEIHRFSSGRGPVIELLARWRTLSSRTRQRRPAAILATGGRMVWIAALLAKIRRIPLLAVGHGTEFQQPNRIFTALNRWSFSSAAPLVCVSYYTASVMSKSGIIPKRLEVIHNGADDSRFHRIDDAELAKIRIRHGLPNGRLLLTVGNVTERKGQETVVRAMPEILRQCPDTHYLMAGIPTRQRELTELADQLGVTQNIHFLGRQTSQSIVELMNLCDLFLMTSVTTESGDCEGFGIAAVEAALCGKPAIVSGGSGLVEAIEEGVTGLAVPQRDATATAEAIVRLLKDNALRRQMGQAAESRAKSKACWKHCVRSYHELLRQIAEKKTDAGR